MKKVLLTSAGLENPVVAGILDAEIRVHAERGSPRGPLGASASGAISLTNSQAIHISDEGAAIIE